MKQKTFLFAAFTAAFLSVANYAAAQVTIGGGDQPTAGAVLDLNSTTKGGLLLSNVSIVDLGQIPENAPNVFPGISGATTEQKQALAGMIVWNTNDFLAPNGDGLYLWDGSKWNYWGGSDGVSILTGAGLPTGSGTFTGKLCFDIAAGNFSGSCGSQSGRNNHKTDFNSPNGVQVYTFTPSGTVNNVRFGFVEAVGAGKIVESIVPVDDYSGTGISSACKVTVNYKSSLQNDLSGLTRDEGLKLKLYAIYNDGNADRSIELNISLQDCACCGANVANNVWKEFMCHNLGADETKDPFTPAKEIHGARYKWGVSSEALTQADDQNPAYNTSVPNWTNITKPPTTNGINWLSTDNPCPPGWRVPTKEEWEAVINTSNNAITKVGTNWTSSPGNYTTGMQVGDALFLPATGSRSYSSGSLVDRGISAHYWTSSAAPGSYVYYMGFSSGSQSTSYDVRSYGFSVRCLSE